MDGCLRRLLQVTTTATTNHHGSGATRARGCENVEQTTRMSGRGGGVVLRMLQLLQLLLDSVRWSPRRRTYTYTYTHTSERWRLHSPVLGVGDMVVLAASAQVQGLVRQQAVVHLC